MAGIRRRRFVYHALKRGLDIGISAAALVAFSPLIGVAALAVRLRLGSPVIFRQQRAGHHGQPIEIIKLRTMTDARNRKGELLPDEERLTRLGKMLRGTSIDELPQLWCVLKGDLSLVGPRPLPLAYVERYNDEQRRRLDVKPGLTGWAQVNGRNRIEWEQKFALDVWYVDHASIGRDIQILARTVKTLLDTDSISAEGHVTMPEFTSAA